MASLKPVMEPEKQFTISESQRNMLLSYLYGRPYAEVARGVKMLTELPEQTGKPIDGTGTEE